MLEEETNRDFPTSLIVDRTRRVIRKDKEDFSNLTQLYLIDIYRKFHLTTKYTFFSGEYEIFAKIDHFMVYKASLKFKRIQFIQNMFSDFIGI